MKSLMLIICLLLLTACSDGQKTESSVTPMDEKKLSNQQKQMLRSYEWVELNHRIREIRCQHPESVKTTDPLYCDPNEIKAFRQRLSTAYLEMLQSFEIKPKQP